MLFTKVGRVFAAVAVFFGCWRIAMGLAAGFTNNQALITRYVGSGTSGEVVDSGFMLLAAGVAFGVLTDISRSLRK